MANNDTQSWQVHRFRERAAIYVGTGSTSYMSAKEARKLARSLYAIARSLENEEFGQSRGLTVSGTCSSEYHKA